MSAPIFIVLALSIIFGVIASIMMIVAVSTDYWEITLYDADKLQEVDKVVIERSVLSNENHFYKVVMEDYVNGNKTEKTFYLRDMFGGIWRVCDTIPGKFNCIDC